MSHKIAVFIEQRQGKIQSVGLELLGEVRRQAANLECLVTAVLLTSKATPKDLERLENAGANQVIVFEDKVYGTYDTHYYSETIIDLIKKSDFDVFLVGSTLIGRDLAPRVSAIVDTGLTADATILEFGLENDELQLYATRPALGGNLFATIICPNNKPQMATVRPGVFAIEKFENDHKLEVVKEKNPVKSLSLVEVLSEEALEERKEDLNKANIIIAGGRGVATKFNTLLEIADLVGGNVAASRAVVDANVQPKHRLVGQTGTTVRPAVYLASGISGAIQHIAGMDKSELIIAVNTDPSAAIFDVASVSIIADANKVLPLVVKELKELHNLKD